MQRNALSKSVEMSFEVLRFTRQVRAILFFPKLAKLALVSGIYQLGRALKPVRYTVRGKSTPA